MGQSVVQVSKLTQASTSALLVASGCPVAALKAAPQTDFLLAIDAGLAVCMQAQRHVDLVVGDLDSVKPALLAEATGATIKQYQVDKDESDLELALYEAINLGVNKITVLLRDGGRLDHQLANLLVLASPRWQSAQVDAIVGQHRLWVVHGERTLPLTQNMPLALHAVGGPAHGVSTTNLEYQLADAELPALVALGISNRVVADSPTVNVTKGVIIAISACDE